MRQVFCIIALLAALTAEAQDRIHVRLKDYNTYWDFPYVTADIDHFTFSDDRATLRALTPDGVVIPFAAAKVDSVTFEDEPAVETKDPYTVFQMYLTVNSGADITSRTEYVPCHISLNARGSFSNYSASASIRGRGNSSWSWYDKKPFRLKLDEKHKLLGLDKAKSWVLLPNYRDVTDLMNTFVFEAARWVGMPYTNHTRYVELFVNGDYRGIYQLTEQVQQGKNRVAVSDDRGMLLSLDQDDGPQLSPAATDNFWSTVYRMPVCVKYPKDEALTDSRRDSVKAQLALLEQAIESRDSARIYSLLDVPSMIHYLQLQELVENVELVAPRSVFLFKDGDGKWTMGPLWDFDAGYDFDWATMTTGHNYFADYRELVLGSNPLKRNGYDRNIPAFFTDLFGCGAFVRDYKAEWSRVADSIVAQPWSVCVRYADALRRGAMEREQTRWPITGKTFDTEVEAMHQWLLRRVTYLSGIVAAYPDPDPITPPSDETLAGTLRVTTAMTWRGGFSQTSKVVVDKARFLSLIGLTEAQFDASKLSIVPLDTKGEEGPNGTNGTYGAWFDADGNPGNFADGHVYIEIFDDLFQWNCGLYQNNCSDDSHTVTMQMRYQDGAALRKVNVVVTFSISGTGGWRW